MKATQPRRLVSFSAFIVVVLLLACQSGCSIDANLLEAEQAFQDANDLYAKGEIEAALAKYLGIFQEGATSGPLLYNIGNCYYRLDEVGRAILFYHRALESIPEDEDLAQNLELANLKVVDKITPLPEFWVVRLWKGLVYLVPGRLLNGIIAVAWIGLAAGLIVATLCTGPWKRWSRRLVPMVAGVLLLALLSGGSRLWNDHNRREAVVLADRVSAFGSPGPGGIELFVLHEGVVVRVDEERPHWMEIVLADGNHGWVRSEDFEII